jgi:class 3 adenylate cyclase/pimeloyl-ACP methyl ester carboxylesterase
VKPPPVRFADSPDGRVAYQVVGDGPVDLVFGMEGGLNIDMVWEQPSIERFLRRLASFSRLILMNPRGMGLSDPIPLATPPTWEEWVMDLGAVLDSVGSDRAALLADGGHGIAFLTFAATFPERTQALALLNCYATVSRHEHYAWGFPPEELERLAQLVLSQWGTGPMHSMLAPEIADDLRLSDWYAQLERSSMSPTNYQYVLKVVGAADLRGILPTIKVPVLVISHAGHPYLRLGHGRYLAEHLPNARYVERPGFWGVPWLHDVDWTLDEVQSFFTGTRGTPDLDDRVLATVLFTDIVGSTRRAAEIGDKRWRVLLDEHDVLTRREIDRFRGRWVKSTGDGLLATFDGPARATRCALALVETVRPLGIEVRAGLHAGEVELRDDDVGGIAVHIADRVMAEATAGEVLVSHSIPPLVAGSEIEFDDRGVRELKGVPGEWKLFAVR